MMQQRQAAQTRLPSCRMKGHTETVDLGADAPMTRTVLRRPESADCAVRPQRVLLVLVTWSDWKIVHTLGWSSAAGAEIRFRTIPERTPECGGIPSSRAGSPAGGSPPGCERGSESGFLIISPLLELPTSLE